MEPVGEPPVPPVLRPPLEQKQGKISKKIHEVVKGFFEGCAAGLYSVFSFFERVYHVFLPKKKELLPITLGGRRLFPKGTSPTMEPLRAAHFRFHRLEVDSEWDAPAILDGSCPEAALLHLVKNDVEPASKILLEADQSDPLHENIHFLRNTLSRSGLFFDKDTLEVPLLAGFLAEDRLQELKEGESLLLSGGMIGHATLYEIKKQGGDFYLKSYNAGEGAELSNTRVDRFVVPCYKIKDFYSLRPMITELLKAAFLPVEKVKISRGGLSGVVERIVTSQGGTRVPSEETHRLQDRGNCTWKCLSTWFRAQCADIPDILITEKILAAAKKHAPYALEALQQLKGKTVKLSRFYKIVGYEKVRDQLNRMFYTAVESQKYSEIAAERVYDISQEVSGPQGKKNIEKRKAVEYLSDLAGRMRVESAVDRYARKDSVRSRNWLVDRIVDKLWALSRLWHTQ